MCTTGELLAKRISGSKDGRDIQSLYMDNGYLFAQIMPVEVSADRDSIDLEIRIIEYDKAYINRVTVKGNTRTFDEIIYRELTTKPGDLFSKTAIMQSQQRIGALGFFDGENIGIGPQTESFDRDGGYRLHGSGKELFSDRTARRLGRRYVYRYGRAVVQQLLDPQSV